jgi:hypothetical protein
MIEGSMSDWRIRAQYEKDPKDEDGDPVCGFWKSYTEKQQGLIVLSEELGAIATVNTFMIHEPLHAIQRIFGMDHLTHQDIYTISSALTEFWLSTGVIDPLAIEARVRKLAADSRDPELSDEVKE